jgi:hypothetical protein
LQAAAGLVASDVAAAIPRAIELTTSCRCSERAAKRALCGRATP